ncbi:MAG: hypothetical protein ACYC7E_11205 [Armatimonadota bacterium]
MSAKGTFLLLTLVILLIGALLPALGAVSPAPLRMLFLHRTYQMDEQYIKELQAEGISVTQRPLTAPLSLEEFKAFNLVVMPDFLTLDDAYHVGAVDVPTWWDTNLPNLRRYVAEGGGLLITTFFCEGGELLKASYDRFLEPWGAEFRAVQIIDPEHIAKVDGMGTTPKDKQFYCWTERIAKHPVTAGVSRVYYPVVNLRWDDCYTTPPVVLADKAWTPLVRAYPGSYSTKTDKLYQWLDPIGHDDVLVASRAVGKGRVVIFTPNSYYTFFRPYTKETSLGENHHGRIDGIVLKAGDGVTPSDDGTLLLNAYRWLAEPGAKLGLGGERPLPKPYAPPQFTVQRVLNWDTMTPPPTWRHRPIPVKIDGQMYYDEQPDPTIKGELKYYRALIGIHSKFSDGKGTVADYAKAAKKAGYGLIAFTERFEDLGGPARWEALKKECRRNSSNTLICLPGIDIADPEGGRYLIFGQPNYPAKTWLSADGKYLTANNVMSLGFTTHMAVIARPQATPHQYRMFKHFQGIAVATYRGGKLVDDGYQAYAWQVDASSNPIPLAVHEVYAPGEIAAAAKTGLQQVMPADTLRHAADYFCAGITHFFDCPLRYFVTEGPVIDTWTIFNKDIGKTEENRNRYRMWLGATSTVPIREVALYAEGKLYRRWTPNATTFRETVDGYQAVQHHWHMVVTDANGRKAISPHLRNVPARYVVRCGDRQNWLGYVAHYYTGTLLPNMDIHMPVKGMREGEGTLPQVRGENLAPIMDFPLASNRICVTDFLMGQRYLNAEKLTDIAFDAAPMRVTVPSRLYEGVVRVHLLTEKSKAAKLNLYEIKLKLKMNAERTLNDVWPWFKSVKGTCTLQGGRTVAIPVKEPIDLQVGDIVGDTIVLSPGMRLAGNRLGMIPPAQAVIPAGSQIIAYFCIVSGIPPADIRKVMNDGNADSLLTLARGAVGRVMPYAKVALAEQDILGNRGIAGKVIGSPVAYDLPLFIANLNPRWTAGVWREDDPLNFTDQFGFIDGVGMTTLDVSRPTRFFAGNLISAENPNLFLSIEKWTKVGITVEVHNPTDKAITARLATPGEITGLYMLDMTVAIPAGTTVRVKR